MSQSTQSVINDQISDETQYMLKLLRTDEEFRNEIKIIMKDALLTDLEKLRDDFISKEIEKKPTYLNQPDPMDYETALQQQFPSYRLEEWSQLDQEGIVYGFPETINIRILYQSNLSFLCDIRDV